MEISKEADTGGEAGQGKQDEQKVEGQEQEPKKETVDPRITASEERARQAELREAQARKDSEGAQAYLQTILGTLKTAAERPANGEQEQDLRERLAEDPEGVLDEHFKARMGPLYNTYLTNQDMLNKQLATERVGKDEVLREFWDKYSGEISEFMQGIPLEVRAQPGSYERAFKFVLANHLDEISDRKAEMKAKRSAAREAGAFVEGPSGAAVSRRQPEGLTDIEKTVAKGLGLTDAEYSEWKGKGQYGT